MNPVRQLLADRISELKSTTGLTMAEISRRLERNRAYLQQFISRGIPIELDERDRLKLAEILQLNPEDLKGPGRSRKWQRVVDWRRPGPSINGPVYHRYDEPSSPNEEPAALQLIRLFTQLLSGESEGHKTAGFLPVYRMVSDDDGLRISIRAGTRLPREIGTNFVNSAYGVIIADNLMAPELRAGGIAIVDPDLPLRPRTTCLFRKCDVDSGGEVSIRRLHDITEDAFVVHSYGAFANALSRFERGANSITISLTLETLPRKDYPHCHVIVGVLAPPVT